MKVIVQYTLADYKTALKLYSTTMKIRMVLRWLLVVLGIFLVMVGLFLTVYGGLSFWKLYEIGLGLFLALYLTVGINRRIRKQFERAKQFTEPVEFTFGKEEIEVHSNLADSKIKWELYDRYLYNVSTLVLVQTTRVITFIPRRAMKDEEWNELLTLVKSKLPSK